MRLLTPLAAALVFVLVPSWSLAQAPPVAPPLIKLVAATPRVLWPPNKKMVPVSLDVSVLPSTAGPSAATGVTPVCEITSVADSDASDTKNKAAKKAKKKSGDDWAITGPLSLKLRAERGKHGVTRLYTIAVTCTGGDAAAGGPVSLMASSAAAEAPPSDTRNVSVAVPAESSQSMADEPPTCLNASPYDNVPDDLELNACFAQGGRVVLESVVEPGYIIQQGLRLTQNNTTVTTTNGYFAFFYAADGLVDRMLSAEVSEFRLEHLFLDGNKWNRSGVDCSDGSQQGRNLLLVGNSFIVYDVYSVNAFCGSAAEVAGYAFGISHSRFSNAGFEFPAGPWADGLTVWQCLGGGVIHDNVFQDNTDVDLIIGNGENCSAWNNNISHVSVYGIAGFMVGSFPGSPGDHTGSYYSNNNVTSSPDLLSFGIMVGLHPWHDTPTYSVGMLEFNSSSGAVVNLAIDGIESGTIRHNPVSGATGNRGFHCSTSADFTLAHYGSADVANQPGTPLAWQFDNGGCGPP